MYTDAKQERVTMHTGPEQERMTMHTGPEQERVSVYKSLTRTCDYAYWS